MPETETSLTDEAAGKMSGQQKILTFSSCPMPKEEKKYDKKINARRITHSSIFLSLRQVFFLCNVMNENRKRSGVARAHRIGGG